MALVAAAAVAGASAVAYLDGKYHLRKDLNVIRTLKRAERDYKRAIKAKRICLWYPFAQTVGQFPSAPAIWSRGRCFTYTEFHDESARYAQWLLEQGIQPGELVAMYLMNSAEFLVVWMALVAIGCAPAFINYNLESKALMHCLGIADTRLIICDDDPECRARIEKGRKEIEEKGTKIVYLDDKLKHELSSRDAIVPGDEYREGQKGDFPWCLVYTSGTTGLPKGCPFTVERIRLLAPHVELPFGQVRGHGGDRWYNAMPMYHGTGAILTMKHLIAGVSVAIGRKFSVRNFWKDIRDSEATFFIYVGEAARYLLNAPPDPCERDHKLRCCYGNGLRPDVWEKFRTRFNIPEIAEFFNSSEGMFSLMNYDRGEFQSACVGHHGLILRTVLHNRYVPVKIDHETGDIWRDPQTGFAKRMPYSEGGEMIVKLISEKDFRGYWRAEAATKKKFVTDVFKTGDLYYRTGDALRREPDGRWIFVDRLGDTFRWKSENVSTAEVATVLGNYPGVAEANVYGVLVPRHDGRAGCVALHLSPDQDPDKFDYNALLRHAREQLPKYAVPVFIRQVKTSTHIHNLKQNKTALRNEGVEPSEIGIAVPDGKDDKFLWVPPRGDKYVPFRREDWDALAGGQARL